MTSGWSRLGAGLALLFASSPVAAQLVREPYLQSVTSGSVIVAWRSESGTPTDSVVYYGTAADALTENATGSAVLRTSANLVDHAVYVGGLAANTVYYYQVGTLSDGIQAGGTANHFFKTAPVIGSALPFSVWIVGDSGRGNATQASVRDGMLAYLDGEVPDLFFHVGDMAYNAGTDLAFTNNHFAQYEEILVRTPFWPAVGNHEASAGDSDSGAQSGPYYEAFWLPTAGQAGGEPSGTEAYYSFDYANVHIVVLDSDDSSTDVGSTQLAWLAEDLAGIPTSQTWLVAMFHHPPYSKGSHDSDSASDSGGRMVRMRENVLPLLEAAGVDLVLSGHSHIYERSYLIDGVYGYGSSPNFRTPDFATLLANGNILDAGDGDPAGDGAYSKPTGRRAHEGVVYVVSGHGGGALGRVGNHPVMVYSEFDVGSCLLNVAGDTLSLRNIDASGSVVDEFELSKETCDDDDACDDGDLCSQARCRLGACEFTPVTCPTGEECDPDTGGCRPEALVVSFRQGADGYDGVVDTQLKGSAAATSHASLPSFEWDTDDPFGTSQVNTALIRFEQLFTSEGGPIPTGASIASATLAYTVFDAGGPGELYEADVDWTLASTYADFGPAPGVQTADLGEFVAAAPGSVATHSVDVTASLQRWSAAPTQNRGWAIVATSSNGTEVRSSEGTPLTTRPLLTVAYFPPATCTTPESCDDGDPCTTDTCGGADGCHHVAIEDCGGGATPATGSDGTTATVTSGGATATDAGSATTAPANAGGASATPATAATSSGNSSDGGSQGGGGELATGGGGELATGGSSVGGSSTAGTSGAGGNAATSSAAGGSVSTGGTTSDGGNVAHEEPNLSDGAGQPGTSSAPSGLQAGTGSSGGCGCRVDPRGSTVLTPLTIVALGLMWQRRRGRRAPVKKPAGPAPLPTRPARDRHRRSR